VRICENGSEHPGGHPAGRKCMTPTRDSGSSNENAPAMSDADRWQFVSRSGRALTGARITGARLRPGDEWVENDGMEGHAPAAIPTGITHG